MDLAMALHKALDYFFCDRCITEAELMGRPMEWGEPFIITLINKLCLIQYLFDLLPDEENVSPRRIYFPRSWLEGSHWHEDDTGGIR